LNIKKIYVPSLLYMLLLAKKRASGCPYIAGRSIIRGLVSDKVTSCILHMMKLKSTRALPP
jgi:hypothetical protein